MLQIQYIPKVVSLLIILLVMAGCQRYPHSVRQVAQAPADAALVTNYTDSTITLPAGAHYKRGALHTLLYGRHYRNAWYTPVNIRVLDISTAHGGLQPLKMGGSRQTVSLRMQTKDSTEYVLRSIDKEPAGALSPRWQKSYVANIARDATSATLPYAALVLPGMAAAVGIYHTDPELVYIPHDPQLGEYLDEMGGTIVLMERRPDGKQKDNPRMGNAEKVKSTRSMLTERLSDNDTKIDARNYLRARLFDMLIGDWSRHEDNWRWAELEPTDDAYTYRPVPRDRDNVFYKLHDAPIPWLTHILKFKPHFRTYRKRVGNLEKLNYNARHLDALILSELSQQDWIEIADSVKTALADQVIESSFRKMPDTIYSLTAEPIIEKLKVRRDNVKEIAKDYYSILAKDALIVGSDKHERFIVKVLNKNEVQVQVYKTNKDEEVKRLLFERTFNARQTKNIILYGLDGKDHFVLEGDADPEITISIWGGEGEDTYTAESKKKSNRIFINDSTYGNNYKAGDRARVKHNDNLRAKDFTGAGFLLHFYLD
ncbi:hypothetical protein JAO76_11250 [Pontibacter sp. BT310]|uniref:FHA domain-containing protein n=1 Tax=Pontibacter populi TaxID=890055 RepID=A0ABS6XCI7_9BACT|nr:hypothetical protein [Pontibacter sp. BT310]MBJ6118773.1 hypothetical protein [Pontibacter sp. BT310]MBR0571202.1 hypothetical protein [Microvirga sp. STS03]MBW3365627.1 hypothetical protein [Pontibacter populi]